MKVKILEIRESTDTKLDSSKFVYEFCRDIERADRELFISIHLDTKNYVIEKEIVHMGSLNSSQVHPRESFKKAIVNSASSVIFVHNHPSGDPEPSQSDRDIAKLLYVVGRVVGIELLDFIIIGKGKYYSFGDRGIFENFKDETKDIREVLNI